MYVVELSRALIRVFKTGSLSQTKILIYVLLRAGYITHMSKQAAGSGCNTRTTRVALPFLHFSDFKEASPPHYPLLTFNRLLEVSCRGRGLPKVQGQAALAGISRGEAAASWKSWPGKFSEEPDESPVFMLRGLTATVGRNL